MFSTFYLIKFTNQTVISFTQKIAKRKLAVESHISRKRDRAIRVKAELKQWVSITF